VPPVRTVLRSTSIRVPGTGCDQGLPVARRREGTVRREGIRAPGMGTEREVRVLWGPDGGNPKPKRQGHREVEGEGVPARGCLVEV